ncbi:phage shock envelope stress response protein PspM [Nocardia sp. NBC_00416]|uniref:phage shock envelope stress response protein PspM n=1 Tax=Nocardia sp. NBC_00416 TaxID=2975991 RepID=UPI002E23D56D
MPSERSRFRAGTRDLTRAWPELQPQAAYVADTLRTAGENAFVAVRRWADPRERELRRRRRARRRSIGLGTVSGLTTAGAVGLVILSAPAWAVVVLGGGAVVLVTGAALSTRRYLRLRRAPLPLAGYVPRRLPAARSTTRPAMARLARAEQVLHDVAGQIARSRRLPSDELEDMVATAASGAAALTALAADIATMEDAVRALGGNAAELAGAADARRLEETVQSMLARLDTGVVEYEHVVAAATRVLAVDETGALRYAFDGIVADLRQAADRMDGWAQALTELADRAPETLLPPAAAAAPRQQPVAEAARRRDRS